MHDTDLAFYGCVVVGFVVGLLLGLVWIECVLHMPGCQAVVKLCVDSDCVSSLFQVGTVWPLLRLLYTLYPLRVPFSDSSKS